VTAAERARALTAAVAAAEPELERMQRLGRRVGRRLVAGSRLLAVGNGGSAAEAQHLAAELAGRFEVERRPLSALALCADASATTAIANDYGYAELFARQVEAHGRPGDVLVALSTSGASPNVLAAARTARARGMIVIGLTGPGDCALRRLCDEALCVPGCSTATVQEVHLLAVHVLCDGVEQAVKQAGRPASVAWPGMVRALGEGVTA
jgi:D-sedoheptulose 7-phosphate isomerase